jgi:hypothetical protein
MVCNILYCTCAGADRYMIIEAEVKGDKEPLIDLECPYA